jgi:preprotein translocase subunit SecE
MARNRQRAKQRQAERRAARLARSADGERTTSGDGRRPPSDEEVTPVEIGGDAAEAAALAAGAPPEDAGRSDAVLEGATLPEEVEDEEASGLDDAEEFDEDEEPDYDVEDEEAPYEPATAGPRGRRGREEPEHHHERGRVLTFLANVWAELQRVQWPDRTAVTSLTGIVLLFVLITGGYLGLLDAIFSKLIDQII